MTAGGKTALVIFDCDGVLVDSEPLAMRVLLEGLAEIGCVIDEAEAYERFLGRSLAAMQTVLRNELGFELPPDRLERMRLRLFEVYRQELAPIPGIVETLDRLTLARCVASSSQPERIRFSLEVTGLLSRFVPHLFSASAVAHGKPAPDLFLHAAERMAVAPAACLVIEDSAAGIEAAQRAGMRVLGFVGGSHARSDAYRAKLAALAPDLIFDDISELPALIGHGLPPRRSAGVR
jgi:HAD superfamily hydrolase (TIGR01509 family)